MPSPPVVKMNSMKLIFKLSKLKICFTCNILFFCFILLSNLGSEEYSIRKKKVSKKQEGKPKSTETTNPIGYSRDNNKISNQFWLEEGAIFSPESLFTSTTVEIPATEPSINTNNQITETKPVEDTSKSIEKPILQTPQKPNFVLHFLNENKKVLLIIALIVIFAVYRLRGDTSSYKNQNTRIFSKFRNK
jgi:Sec region non-globular protein